MPAVLLPLDEVRRRLGGVHLNTVRNLIRRGDLASIKVGTRVMVAEAELDDYIARNTEAAV